MDGVKRYDLTCGDGGMYQDEDPSGAWVASSDFGAELARYAADLKLRDRELEIAAEHHSELQEQLAALREELATTTQDRDYCKRIAEHNKELGESMQKRLERTESALNGSMKALTRVDNMWKKRWLEKTGEPAMALVVDDEFRAMFEDIKEYRQRLTAAEHDLAVANHEIKSRISAEVGAIEALQAAEQRNAELVELLNEVTPELDDFITGALLRRLKAALINPAESGASEPKHKAAMTPAEKYPDKYRYGCMFCAGRGCSECVKLGQGEHKP